MAGLVLTGQFYKDLIAKTIDVFDPGIVQVYKFSTITPDIYRQGTRTYLAPVDVKAVIRTQRDTEQITEIGNRNENYLYLTIAIEELEDKFPSAAIYEWIKLEDLVRIRGKIHSVQHVNTLGSKIGEASVVVISAREYPDNPIET